MAVVTIKDIAKECGVSFSTVSKALKGSSEIGVDTIKNIQETAKRMGYQPNAAARKLRTNRSYDLGVIFEDSTGSGLMHQYFASIFDSFNVTANLKGYNISFLNSVNTEIGSYLTQTRYRGFDGVAIFSTNDFHRADIQELIHSDIPICMLDYVVEEKASSVLSDNKNGMEQLLKFLISKGHKKIAFIHGELSGVTHDRLEAFYSVLKENNIEIPEEYVIEGMYHEPTSSETSTRILLDLPDPPTCILYPDDFAYLGGVKVLNERHLIPGKDISIVGYDGIFLSSVVTPVLTTYAQNAKEIGKQMAELLISKIENSSEKYQIVNVNGKIREGQTVNQL